MKRKVFGIIAVLLAWSAPLSAQALKEQWVDSVFNQLSLDQKIGQLFMVPSGNEEDDINSIRSRIKNFDIGGVFFREGVPVSDPNAVFNLQAISQIPLLTGVSGTRILSSLPAGMPVFPEIVQLGAIANDTLLYQLGKEISREMKTFGLNTNFFSANLLQKNSWTDLNGYSDNHVTVASKSLQFLKGLQEGNIIGCAQSFPIHGINVTTVQKGMPDVVLTVDSAHAYPFKIMIRNDLEALMPASSDLPLFYTKKKTAVSNLLTSSAMTASFAGNWIRNNMNYKGVIFVDVDGMEKSTDKFQAGEAEVFAFQAGNDVLLTSSPLGPPLRKIKKLLRSEKIYRHQLDQSVRKILSMKYEARLSNKSVPVTSPLATAIAPEGRIIAQKLFREAVTVLSNKENLLPIKFLEDRTFRIIVADDSVASIPFVDLAHKYVRPSVTYFNEKKELVLQDPLRARQIIIVLTTNKSTDSTVSKIVQAYQSKALLHDFVFADFGSAALQKHAAKLSTVVMGYSSSHSMLRSVVQAIFGAFPANGILPVGFGDIAQGSSVQTVPLQRLGYSFPEAEGMDAKTLAKIEAIANEAIDIKATPGCQVLIARNGQVVYEQSFGHLTYEKQTPVSDQIIYDLASITKVAATLQTVMFMHDKGLIDVNKKASVYLPELKKSNKKDFTIKDILTHQAGLWPFLPFWAQTMVDTTYLPGFYSRRPSDQYPYFVAEKLFASSTMKDSLWSWIVKSKVREKPQRTPYDYRYSDMGFYIFHHLAEKILNQPMEDFLAQNLYDPLGATRMGYLPLLKFSVHNIAPTENDKLFRRSLLIGAVHDQGAAMHGGVAGHAGLFSTATDLAKLGQMLLQQGRYGGIQYYKPETVQLFTQKQFETSRRGLGWDKPTVGETNGPTSYYSSAKTFGHTGFTGTCIWIDPEFDLVYIFLSNRVHPDMTNNKLLTANIRSRIQDVTYQSIFNYCKINGEESEAPIPVELEQIGRSQ